MAYLRSIHDRQKFVHIALIMSQKSPNSTANSSLLDRYRKKRRFDATAEPFGANAVRPISPASTGLPQFMTHHHAARNTHYDLRLEMDGVQSSWRIR
jgi:hypothetical protein